ncbi:hypothetical protein WFZ85_01445 [Flavobacterium sp. j3]|uniref:Uncharacterized protein n=1 Tax=Flavobacterium aureirubrum TaxID=3133147 RepID=A0ABU9N3X7_9FLAO
MKKVIFGFIATAMFSTVSFANTPALENEINLKKENQIVTVENENKEESESSKAKTNETLCVMTCSFDLGDGLVITASAGNFLMSCEKALSRCIDKLIKSIG